MESERDRCRCGHLRRDHCITNCGYDHCHECNNYDLRCDKFEQEPASVAPLLAEEGR